MKFWLVLMTCCFMGALQAETRVLAFSGSLREDSFNHKLIDEASEIARDLGASVTVIRLKDYPMPFYDADLEKKEGMPFYARKFKRLIQEHDVILIASPEYNGSMSGVLKNALDWATRNEGKHDSGAFKNKKFALLSASGGQSGGINGLRHIKDVVESEGGFVVPKQVSIPKAYEAFDAFGKLQNADYREALKHEIEMALTKDKKKKDYQR